MKNNFLFFISQKDYAIRKSSFTKTDWNALMALFKKKSK